MTETTLKELRAQINAIDEQLVGLITKRAELAQAVGAAKVGAGLKFRPSREAEVLRRVTSANNGPLADDAVRAIFREVIGACLNLEEPTRVGYLGPAGTYSEEAARKRFGAMAELVPQGSLDDVLHSAERGETSLAILPIENSTEGGVNRTLDLLLQTKLQVVGETSLPIHHQLLSQAHSLAKITDVTAHPQSLAQCRDWLQKHLPNARLHSAASNAEAAVQASKNPHMAAIASKIAAELYELPILAKDIEDDASNTTRFVVLGNVPTQPTGSDKTSLICAVANKPGALSALLQVLATFGINMTRLESRPAPSGLWDYVFYIDIDGHADDEPIVKALAAAKEHTQFIKVIGSYPKEV